MPWNRRTEIDEIAFKKTGNNVISSYSEDYMLLGKSYKDFFVAVKKFCNFGKGFSRNDEIKLIAVSYLFLADCKTETVNGNN